MLRVARFELRKSRRRYGKGSMLLITLASLFALIVSYLSVTTGIDSDSGIYSTNVLINDHSFILSDDPDVYFDGSSIFVKKTDRSLAAADELIQTLKEQHREIIEEKYGKLAHPVLVSVKYITVNLSQSGYETTQREAGVEKGKNQTEKKVRKGVEVNKTTINTTNYKPPEDIKTPSLVEKMVLAFLFIIPSYFTVQVFSSSLLEDKLLRRLEVMLSAVGRVDILLGKLLPYLSLSFISALAVSLLLNSPMAFIFALPVIFLLFTAQSFVVMISRSYREATFLLLVVSLLITIYAFIPAVFSTAIPLSKISPITLLLSHLRGESVNLWDALVSFAHLGVMAAILFYLSTKALNPDIAHGRSMIAKLIEISRLSVRNSYQAFLFAFLSVSFALMAEIFAVMTVFILPQALMIPALIVSVAIVEEIIKGVIIVSQPCMRRAIATALGFFTGEKFLIVANVLQEYSLAFLGQHLVFPLALHLLTAILFASIVRKSYSFVPYALSLAVAIHAIYNYVVVMLLV
ncbi:MULTISPECIES: hypothetical protein [unclassified Archaeoglobus]|uniref:hypothetical protein n=1 Tax=unclassified Archaeoglobus TaxID=2643606 RepID=UPI0025C152EB|nr:MULTISPECIES: hypothetical protein [unclassified Archaeoglobus]